MKNFFSKNNNERNMDIVKKFKMVIFLFSLSIVVFCAVYFLKKPVSILEEIKVVETDKANLKNIKQTTNIIGTVKAKYYSMLTAQDNGILNMIAQPGSKMKKGELIAVINNSEVEQNYYLSLNAENLAKNQSERAEKLLKSAAYSKYEFEKNKHTWIIAQKDLLSAKKELEKLKIYAPFDGFVGSYKTDNGHQLRIGDAIVSFYDPSSIKVEFDIPESLLHSINNGSEVFILGKTYYLTNVQKLLDRDKHMSNSSVDIECDNCVIGSNIDVTLSIVDKKGVIVIPFDAVFLKSMQTNVYVVKDNKLLLRPVKLGVREKELVEIISGLEVGEEFVISNTNRLYDGIKVKTHKM